MATRFLDTGEAYLSSAEKQFARVTDIPVHIERSTGFGLSPNLTSILLVVAIGAVALFAFSF